MIDLEKSGFDSPVVLPIPVCPEKWNEPPDSDVMGQMNDGKANLLFVGRVTPNKCVDHLIEAFSEYIQMDPNSRLVIVGEIVPDDPYGKEVLRRIESSNLKDHIVLTGKVRDCELNAYMRTSRLFWSMSEHEGFCVPLIEAMWFDVPVLAYKSSAIPETLGDAGFMFNTKQNMADVAALAKLLVRNDTLREKVLNAQRKRREDFLPEKVFPCLDELIERMETAL